MWDKEPKFWSDTLTQELWKLFRENPENQQAQEGEGLTSGLGGVPWVSRQTSLLSISSSSPVVMATDRGAAGTGEYPWLGPPTHLPYSAPPTSSLHSAGCSPGPPGICWVPLGHVSPS